MSSMRHCNRCGADKPATAEHWMLRTASKTRFKGPCRNCRNEKAKQERRENPKKSAAYERGRKDKEKRLADARARYAANPEKARKKYRDKRNKNIEAARAHARKKYAQNPKRQREATKRWFAKNPDKPKQYWRTSGSKRRCNPKHILNSRIGALMREALIKRGSKKSRKKAFIVGWTIDQLAVHLELLFEPGMSFANFGDWEIDHIIPLSRIAYQSEDDPNFRAAWALSNLAPLWASDNTSKHARLNWELPNSYKNSRLRAMYENANFALAA